MHEQIFIAHRGLILDLLCRLTDGRLLTSLIDFPQFIAAGPEKLGQMRRISADLINQIEEADGKAIFELDISNLNSIGEGHGSSEFAISPAAVAGLLLSYPCIYNSLEANATVTDKEVDLYSVYVEGNIRRSLMQFSVPIQIREEVTVSLKDTIKEWEVRIHRMPDGMSQIWQEYTGGGAESCTLKIQLETRRVPVMKL
jgi:hypothetical protein